MQYAGDIITRVRRATNNESYNNDGTEGIIDNVFLGYINDAQERLQSLILAKNPNVTLFDDVTTVSVSVGEYQIDLPTDCYSPNLIRKVEWIDDGGSQEDYEALVKYTTFEQSLLEGTPTGWGTLGNSLILTPVPDQAGTIRITYPKPLKRLTLRDGTVTAVTIASPKYLTVVCGTTKVTNTDENDYFSVFDGAGRLFYENMLAYSYTSGTGTLTTSDTFGPINAGTALATVSGDMLVAGATLTVDTGHSVRRGDIVAFYDATTAAYVLRTITAVSATTITFADNVTVTDNTAIYPGIGVGQFVSMGYDTTTHTTLPQALDRYLFAYCKWCILREDSSMDSQEAQQELGAIESDIISMYKVSDKTVKKIPIINNFWV